MSDRVYRVPAWRAFLYAAHPSVYRANTIPRGFVSLFGLFSRGVFHLRRNNTVVTLEPHDGGLEGHVLCSDGGRDAVSDLRALTQHVFTVVDVPAIYSYVRSDNRLMRIVCFAAGFRYHASYADDAGTIYYGYKKERT